MDKFEFSAFVSWLSIISNRSFDKWTLEDMYNRINNMFPEPDPITVTGRADAQDVRDLLKAMADRRKIDAIKLFRNLTKDELRESKDAVENVTSKFARETT